MSKLFEKCQLRSMMILIVMLATLIQPVFSEYINTQGSGAPQNMTISENVTINLIAEKMAFNTSTITVPAGAHLIVNFENRDVHVPHNFAVYDSSMQIIFRGKLITGPSKTAYAFDAPKTPGTYRFQCDPHASFMNGRFIVT